MQQKKPKLKLRPFQRDDVNFLRKHRLRALVASAPGTGKTAVSITAVAEEADWSFPVLVVCPASVTANWGREIRRWAPGCQALVVDDMTTRIPKFRHPFMFYIVSWSLLDTRLGDLLGIGIKTVIADECHYAKSSSSLRSNALAAICKAAQGVLLLSGTPLVNTKLELEVLNAYLGSTEPPMIRRILEDVAPDIPPKTRSYLHIDLPEKERREYNKANDDFEQWLTDQRNRGLSEGRSDIEVERILAAEALMKIGYLRRMVGEAKVKAAVDWIARAVRLGEPVVVFAEHQPVVEGLSKGLRKQRIKFEVIDGSTSPKRRQEIVDSFQRNEFPVFIGSKAAKEGITLTAARHLLFAERYFTSADEEQAEDRIRRIGQTFPTTIWFLHAVDTVDDRIDDIVRTKRQIVRAAIGAPEIVETPQDNVESMIRDWGKHTGHVTDREVLPLGIGDPLPPLPSPAVTHGIVFASNRWTTLSAMAWCRMHGYANGEPLKRVDLDGRFKLVLHPFEVFRKDSLEVFKVCSDVRVLQGKRIAKSAERKIRTHQHRMKYG